MDLQPVELQDLIDEQMGDYYGNIPEVKYIKNEYYDKSVYNDGRIGEIINIHKENTIRELIENILISCEANDVYQMHHLVSQLKEIRFSKNLSANEAGRLLQIFDKCLRNNYRDFNFANDILSLMNDLASIRQIHQYVKLDWKIYYKMFILFYGISKYEFCANYSEKFLKDIHLCDFIKKANKLFTFTEEDYQFLREEVLRRLVTIDGQIAFGLLSAHLFLPADYLAEDEEMQTKFLTILENRNELSNYILLNLCKIITRLKVDKEKLIDMAFSLSFCIMSEGLTQTYFSWPDSIYRERSSSVPLCYIIANFVLNKEFSDYHAKVMRNLQILVNLISEELTENSSSDCAFSTMKLILRNIKQLSSQVSEYEVSEYDYFREYTILEEYKPKVAEVVKIFHPIASKCLLYNESATFSVFIEYMALSYCKVDEFRDIINHLFESSSDDYNFLVKKIKIFLRCYIDHIEDKHTYNFLIDFIDTSIDKISSVSGSLNNNILDFFNNLLTICMHKRKKILNEQCIVNQNSPKSSTKIITSTNTNFFKLCKKLNTACEEIVKKMLLLFTFFSSILEEMSYNLFFYHMTEYIEPQIADNICVMITTFFEENILNESRELSFLSYLMSHFYRRDKWKYSLEENIWDYCYRSLVDDGTGIKSIVGRNQVHKVHHVHHVHPPKLRDISKNHFNYIKKLLPYLERIEEIKEDQFITLIKLLLKGKDDKKKVAFLMMKFFFYNLTLPALNEKKVNYPKEETLKFAIDVYEEIVKPYEEEVTKVLNSDNGLLNNNNTDNTNTSHTNNTDSMSKFEENLIIYLRTSTPFILKCNNIFLCDINLENHPKVEEILKTLPEYSYYTKLRTIREKLRKNALDFHHQCMEKKLIGKAEKYFRRAYFSQLVEYDRFYHMRIISTYRKYLVYYRELNFSEMCVVYKYLSNVTLYSHIKLFKIKEKHSNLKVVEKVLREYIKNEDRVLIDHSLFKTSLMLLNLKPESEEAYQFFHRIVYIVERKLGKIPITNEYTLSNVKKFDRIVDVLYSTVSVYICKISDVALLLATLNKFRTMVDKFMFNTSNAIENLKHLTSAVYYFIAKPVSLLDRKMETTLSPYILGDTADFNKIQLDVNSRSKIREYIQDILDNFDMRFNSNNYHDSLNLIIDFFMTVRLSLDITDEKDAKLYDQFELLCLRKFLQEDDDYIKKRIFFAGFGLVESLKYRCSKMVVKSSQAESDMTSKRNFDSSYGSNDKIYKPSKNEVLQELVKNGEGIARLFEAFYKFQERDQLNLLKNTGGVFDTVNRRLQHFAYPQFKDSVLVYERSFFLSSLPEAPSLFNIRWARILFYIFYFSNEETELNGVNRCNDELTELNGELKEFNKLYTKFESMKSDSDTTDEIVAVNTLMMFTYALVKKYKIKGEWSKITKILKKVMSLYTLNFNKRLDIEIFNLIGSVVRMCSPKEVRTILTCETEDKLILFSYDKLFTMKMLDLLSQRFEHRTYLVFNEESIRELDRVKSDALSDQLEWMKNSSTFEYFFIDYLGITRIKQIDCTHDYIPAYNTEKMTALVEHLLQFFRRAQTKESLKLLNVIFKEALSMLIMMPELMVDVVGEFTCYIRLDPQNYKRRIEYCVNSFHQLYKFKTIDFFTIVDFLSKKMDTYVFPESFKFCTDIMRKLLIPRLSKLIVGRGEESYDKLSKVVEVAKNAECRDYFLHYVLYKVIHSITERTITTIINKIYKQILADRENKNSKHMISLVTILTSFLMDYEIIINPSTEMTILKLRELNKSVFRNLGNESKIIKKSITGFYNKYSYTFPLVKSQVSDECVLAIHQLSKSQTYFI